MPTGKNTTVAKQCGLSNQKMFIMNHFDYFRKEYGKPRFHISNYKFFLHIEATNVEGLFEMELLFRYRVDSDNVLEIILNNSGNNSENEYYISGRFQLHEPFYRGLLKKYIREYIQGVIMYCGLDYDFHESPVMSEGEFRNLLEDIEADLKIIKYRASARWSDAPMTQLCSEYNLEIIHNCEDERLAECNCPNGHNHRIKINLESGTWFCGYCRINGDVKKLRELLEKQHTL